MLRRFAPLGGSKGMRNVAEASRSGIFGPLAVAGIGPDSHSGD